LSWLGWHEGLVTLRSIAAWLRLREGHISNLIRHCEEIFGENATLLAHHDRAVAACGVRIDIRRRFRRCQAHECASKEQSPGSQPVSLCMDGGSKISHEGGE
jgi:hypothetical protein